jgi:hypothetical protein
MKQLNHDQLAGIAGGSDPISQPLNSPDVPQVPHLGPPFWVETVKDYLKYLIITVAQ